MSEYTEHVYQEYHCTTYEPIHQREKIVRCRDCAKADYAEVHMFDGTRQKKWTCTRFECFHHMVKPDGFCAWGTRREP